VVGDQEFFALFFFLLVPFFMSVFFSYLVLRIFPRFGFIDNPKKYNQNRQPIPLPGGLAPVLSFLFSLLLFFPKEEKYLALFFAISLIAFVSFIDDRKGLPISFRLFIHVSAAGILLSSGVYIQYIGNPFGETFDLMSLSFFFPILFTIFWLVGFSNVMNWLDGVPGLSAGSAMFAGIFLAVLSLTPTVSQPEIAHLAFVFSASVAGFFFFNVSPPKMLLGDTGAMVFGFILASISIFSGGKMATVFIVLALPLLDFMYVIFRRILSGRSPFCGRDNLHLHDRLALVGFSERLILIFFLFPSLFLGWLSLQFGTLGKMLLITGLIFCFILFSWGLEKKIASKKKKK
jgi:UDP-GlcNAc:undecaprenyl-phosphate GlcNAc-1-phosphate transferase